MLPTQALGRLGYAEYALTSACYGALRLVRCGVGLKPDDQPQTGPPQFVDVAARRQSWKICTQASTLRTSVAAANIRQDDEIVRANYNLPLVTLRDREHRWTEPAGVSSGPGMTR
jgi:hypothetical protein